MAFNHLDHVVSLGHKFSHVFIHNLAVVVFGHFLGLHHARAHGGHLGTVVGINDGGHNVATKGRTNLVEQVVVVLLVLLVVKIANLECRTVGSKSAGER